MTVKILLGCTGLLLIATAPASARQQIQAADFPVSSLSSDPTRPAQHRSWDAEWLGARYDEINRELNGGVDLSRVGVVFVGDSITQFWRNWRETTDREIWDQPFADRASPYYALNLGVSGDRTENVMLRLLPKREGGFGEFDNRKLKPRVIVLMIGVNNTWNSDEPVVEHVVDGNVAIINRLRALRPGARILVNSLLPAENADRNNRYIRPINALLRDRIVKMGPQVTFVDIYPGFIGTDGSMRKELYTDGVHPNVAGYTIWKQRVTPAIVAAMSDPAS